MVESANSRAASNFQRRISRPSGGSKSPSPPYVEFSRIGTLAPWRIPPPLDAKQQALSALEGAYATLSAQFSSAWDTLRQQESEVRAREECVKTAEKDCRARQKQLDVDRYA